VRPMRVLYIHQYFATRRGSSGTRSYEQARAMRAAGHHVTMLTSVANLLPDEIPPGEGVVRCGRIDGLDLIVLNVPYRQQMSYARRVLAFARFMAWSCRIALAEPRVELLYATSTPLTVGIPAFLAKCLRSVPYVFEVRDLWPDAMVGVAIRKGLLYWLLAAMERLVYGRARLIVTVNEDVAAAIRRKTHGRKPIVVVPNACDTGLFRPDRDGSEFRRAHGLEGKILCVHTGAMGRVNDCGSILDAADAMRDRPDVRFVLIGRGNQRRQLEQRVERERLGNVLILDAVPKRQLADVLATADVGLMTVAPIPILELNCANKYFDYLASGLPVVLNYRGWQARLLARHDCGLSARQADAEGFIEAIRTLCGQAALRARMGANARRLAETELNRKTVVGVILEWLARLADERDGLAR
jgi:glycosyltransferase involved in cell wall biosynthesis